jgi:hypothetical protein
MTKKPPDPRLDEISKTLSLIMDVSGLSRREIATRLGGDYGVRRILDGSPELRVRQLLSFADAVEMKPIEILRIALGDDGKPSPMALRLQEQSSLLFGIAQRLQVTVTPPPPAAPLPAVASLPPPAPLPPIAAMPAPPAAGAVAPPAAPAAAGASVPPAAAPPVAPLAVSAPRRRTRANRAR